MRYRQLSLLIGTSLAITWSPASPTSAQHCLLPQNILASKLEEPATTTPPKLPSHKKDTSRTEDVVGVGLVIKVGGTKAKSRPADNKLETGAKIEVPPISNSHPVFIIDLVKESPADQSGLKVLDRITRVDDLDVNGLSLGKVVERIRGKVGTRVTLTVLRTDEVGAAEEKSFTLVRKRLSVPAHLQN